MNTLTPCALTEDMVLFSWQKNLNPVWSVENTMKTKVITKKSWMKQKQNLVKKVINGTKILAETKRM